MLRHRTILSPRAKLQLIRDMALKEALETSRITASLERRLRSRSTQTLQNLTMNFLEEVNRLNLTLEAALVDLQTRASQAKDLVQTTVSQVKAASPENGT
jgi:hypothetical protein